MPAIAEVVLEEQEPPYVMVPASEDVIIKSGVVSLVGVLISLPETPGAVVSVVVLSVEVVSLSEEVVVVLDAPSSLLLAHEMRVRLKKDMKIM